MMSVDSITASPMVAMGTMATVGLVVAALAVVLSVPLLAYALFPGSDGDGKTLGSARSTSTSQVRGRQLNHSAADRLVLPAVQRLFRIVRRVTPIGLVDSTARRLVAAGMTNTVPLEVVIGLKVVIGGVAASIALLLISGRSIPATLGAVVLAGGIGFLLPDYHLGRKAGSRQDRIRADLPEVLDQLTVIVEAGLGFDSAVKRVVSSTEGPLSDEFSRVLRSIRLGSSRSEALGALADRVEVVEVRQFVAAIRQADQLGVPIARILRTQSEHMRELTRLEAEEQAMRLPVKLTFPMVFCMLPALFVVVLGPMVIRLVGGGFG